VAPPVEDEKLPLPDAERNPFQPNPFFGSQSSLFKK